MCETQGLEKQWLMKNYYHCEIIFETDVTC